MKKFWNLNPIDNKWELTPIEGEFIVCTTDNLTHFTKNEIYVGEKYNKSRKIKLKGIPGYHSLNNFTFAENIPAINRQIQIDKILDTEIGVTKMPEIRKIDRLNIKNKLLVQAMVHNLYKILGDSTCIYKVSDNFSFDKVVDNTINSVYKKYDLTKEDYEQLGDMTLREILDNFIHHSNL